jgi:hypothetical protein
VGRLQLDQVFVVGEMGFTAHHVSNGHAFDSAMSPLLPLSTTPDTAETRLLVAIVRPIRKL